MPKFSVLRMAGSEIIRTMGAMLLIILVGSQILDAGAVMTGGCRTFCGNITVDYPFGIEQGCGHPKYRDLVYCINNVMMFHVISGSYEVVNIDYGFKVLDIFDPKMSTCASMHKSDGFFLEEARSRYLQPTPDNAFMLLGCSKASPLFEGFPDKHLPCRNVTGMGCDAFYDCPSWVGFGKKSRATRPPPYCGIPYSSIGSLNLSRLQCYSYATVYNRAHIKVANPYTSIAPAFLSLYVQEEVKGKEHGFGDGQHGENEDRRHLFDERHGGNEGEQGLFDAQLGRNEEKIGSQVENGECVEKGARVRPSRRGAKAKENKNDTVSPFVGRITRARAKNCQVLLSAKKDICKKRTVVRSRQPRERRQKASATGASGLEVSEEPVMEFLSSAAAVKAEIGSASSNELSGSRASFSECSGLNQALLKKIISACAFRGRLFGVFRENLPNVCKKFLTENPSNL